MALERHVALCLEAVRRAATVVDVPGAPRSLRLDRSESRDGVVRLTWSFLDPEVTGRRIREVSEVVAEPGEPERIARAWWAEVQLAAARRYKLQVDADWEPGAPYVPRTWGTEEAWQALVDHLAGDGADVRAEAGEIRVRRHGEETVYRIDPVEWAAFLNTVESQEPSGEEDIVPVATPLEGWLPQWAVDDLDETAGSSGPVVGLVEGELVGLVSHDE